MTISKLLSGAFMAITAIALSTSVTFATGFQKYTICHASGLAGTKKYETLELPKQAFLGHFYENGTTRAGHEQDYMGPCKVQAPVCDLSKLSTLPAPNPQDWNHTGLFQVKNNATTPMTFDWYLDMWGSSSQDKDGTKTLAPGESIVLGFGKICSKWQLDLTCNGKETGFIVESNTAACATPTPTPVCTPSPTPSPSPTPTVQPTATPVATATPVVTATPVATPIATPEPTSAPSTDSSPEKQSKMSITDATCTNNNMDSSIELFNNGNPVAGVNIKFIYENEAKYAKTESNGRAGVMFGYKSASDIVIEPEDGYPSQRQQAHAVSNNCPVVATAPQVLGLADTGVFEDTLATIAGVFGTLSTAIGSILYVKNKKTKSTKSKNK